MAAVSTTRRNLEARSLSIFRPKVRALLSTLVPMSASLYERAVTTIPPSDGQGKVTGGDSDEMRAGSCRLSELWRQPALLELVEPIQGGDFVGLAQRGVVENCVPKIFNAGAQREYDLADVHDFRRPVADDVDAQKLKRVRVEK